MRGRRWCQGLVVFAAIANADAARAREPEPDPTAPSVCAPPCSDGEVCVDNTCVPASMRPPPPRAPARPPPSPPAAAPAPDYVPYEAPPPAPAPAPPPPAPVLPRLTHDQPPGSSGVARPPQATRYARAPDEVPAPPPPRRMPRFLALPYLGIHSYQNAEATGYGLDPRVGVVLGGRIGEVVSMNGELTIDVSTVHSESAVSYQERAVDLAFSPLFEIPAGRAEVVLGPKLGVFAVGSRVTDMGFASDQNLTGYVVGANAGLFLRVWPRAALGAFLSLELKWGERRCLAYGEQLGCSSVAGAAIARVLGVNAAALF